MVNWHGAVAFADWESRRCGRAYRLPGELEFEKAARGVDGRSFPWGDAFDPTWAGMRLSREGSLRPVEVDAFPVDVSPYGARGMAGNTISWCADEYRREGPPLVDGIYLPPGHAPTPASAPCAAGAFCSTPSCCGPRRATTRRRSSAT
jgi:formylglycine-generating enzyme required for sulfatase activity